MAEYTVEKDWRTIQLFLTKDYVAEVEVNSADSNDIRCTCLKFKGKKGCNHTKFVNKTMKNEDGDFTINIPVEIDDDLAQLAITDSEMFRQFIIDYGKVEVLD